MTRKAATAKRSASTGQFIQRPSAEQELTAMKKVADYLKDHPEKLKQLAVEMKIHTKTGRLTKVYGG